jgi:hypothetical protein
MTVAYAVAVGSTAAIRVAAVLPRTSVDGQTSVATGTSTVVMSSASDRYDVAVSCTSGTAYIGSASVTDTDGFPLGPGDSVTLTMRSGKALYARCATGGTATLRVLAVGQ